MFVTLRGEPYLLWRAVDEHGAELDILLQKRRDKAAAKRFFKRVLRSSPAPRKIVTDQLRSYPAAKAEIAELSNVKHVFFKAAARLNNRAENSHQSIRERRMRGFRDPKRTQKFLSSFGPIRLHFALRRHLLRASLHRKQVVARFAAWREFAEVTQNPPIAVGPIFTPAVVPYHSRQVDKAVPQGDRRARRYAVDSAARGRETLV
jgi:putative transposase